MFSVFVLDCAFPEVDNPGAACIRFDGLTIKEVGEIVRFCGRFNQGNDLIIRPYLPEEEEGEVTCRGDE